MPADGICEYLRRILGKVTQKGYLSRDLSEVSVPGGMLSFLHGYFTRSSYVIPMLQMRAAVAQ